jgi:peptidoglycan L-alanyl-D-glutamate endopeptidase CwlK
MKLEKLKLHPEFTKTVEKLLSLCEQNNFPITIYCGLRTFEEQAVLYGHGRTRIQIEMAQVHYRNPETKERFLKACVSKPKEPRKTNAIPGKSFHNYGLAIDGAPLEADKSINWNVQNPKWEMWADFGEQVGCESAARWKDFKEYPHLQIGVSDFNKLFKTNFENQSQAINWLFENERYL